MDRTNQIKVDFKYILITSFVGVINSVFCYNKSIALLIVAIEVMCLSFLLIKRDYFRYTCYYIIFMTMSLEFSDYYGTSELYGFKETRIFGIGVATIAVLPIVLYGLSHIGISAKIRKPDTAIKKFENYIIFIFSCGVIVGLFNILINDNNVRNLTSVFGSFFNELYNFIILLLFPLVAFAAIIRRYSKRIEELKSVLFSIMIGMFVSQLFSFLSPFKGSTWESTTLLVSFVTFYIPMLVCFAYYYKDSRIRIAILCIGCLGTLFSAVYTVTSGGLLVVLFVPIFILIILNQRGERKTLFAWIVMLLILVIALVASINMILNNASILFEYKLSQALSLIEFWRPGWFDNLPPSVKFRFQEFGNIIQEYIRKPYAIFLGKGIMGTCLDYNGDFYASHYVGNAAFTKGEWDAHVFYSMHESLNVLFLTSGFVGLSFLFWTVKTCLKNLSISPFLCVGIIYILFHFTYSFTASYFGILCILVGLNEIDKYKVNELCQ